MDIDNDKIFVQAITDGIRKGVADKFTGYNSPLDKLIASAIETHAPKVRQLLEDSIASCVGDVQFREEIAAAVRKNLAKTLVQRFGGEIEKQVNVLKSDPTTRARITLAIEEITKSSKA